MTERKSSLLRQKRWEERCVCLICGATMATAKWHKVARHFSTCHKSFQANYPPCSELRAEKICVLKAALGKEQSFLTRLGKNLKLHLELQMFGLRTRKPFRTGRSWKEQWWLLQIRCWKTRWMFSAFSDVQLGANTMVRRASVMFGNLTEQLDRDLDKCRWFSIQCDESRDSSSTLQLMMSIWMVFDDFFTKESLTQLTLKTTTRGVDIYNTVKMFFVEKKCTIGKAGVGDYRQGSRHRNPMAQYQRVHTIQTARGL